MQVLETGQLLCKMDEFDFIVKRYSKPFQKDLEVAAKFCELYSNIGKSAPSRLNHEDSDIDHGTLLETLETLENPTVEVVDTLFDKFVKLKQATHQGYTVIEEVQIKEILEYGHLDIKPISYNMITNLVEPSLAINLGIVLDRPSPYLGSQKVKVKSLMNRSLREIESLKTFQSLYLWREDLEMPKL